MIKVNERILREIVSEYALNIYETRSDCAGCVLYREHFACLASRFNEPVSPDVCESEIYDRLTMLDDSEEINELDRVIEEQQDLERETDKLRDFLRSKDFAKLDCTNQFLLTKQFNAMEKYLQCLFARIGHMQALRK